jgi:tetratricopeptide (TPR) repeat protein
MKKPQYILVIAALILLSGLYFLGPTVAPGKKNKPTATADSTDHEHFDIKSFNQQTITGLSAQRQDYLGHLQEEASTHSTPSQSEAAIHANHQLASFWHDSVPNPPLHFYYVAKAAELDNSEKSLTFAAHSILGYLPFAQNAELQSWLAGVGRELFEMALVVNPANDSSVVGVGGCIMYGASSDPQSSMQGIMKVREVAEKDSSNLFAQYMLGVGGMMSQQYDKAAIRFEKVARAQPDNMEVLFKLAEANELLKDNRKAIYWYQQILPKVPDPQLKAEIENRIEELKKK